MIQKHDNLRYHKGFVLASPAIYSVFIGRLWNQDGDHRDRMNLLKQFLTELLGSGFMNVLSQYGSGFGAGNGGCFMQSAVDEPDDGRPLFELTDRDVRQKIQALITGGVIARPGTPTTVGVFVFLADNVNINDANDPTPPPKRHVTCLSEGADFGYHDFFTTTKGDMLPYAVISSADDDCVRIACELAPARCPLSAQLSRLDRQTLVTSHELAEMFTNPNRGGWFDDQDGPDPGDEIADIAQKSIDDPVAAGQITASRPWAVQKVYSASDAAAGRDPAVVSAPSPLAKLAVAPAPRRVSLAAIHQLNKGAKILPLPDIHVDAAGRTMSRDVKDTRAFLKRLFDPHRPEDLVADLPTLLRHLADVVEKDM
jgi:hypothetical protein